MRIFDTLTGRPVELVPRDPGRVSLYVCGPTVYSEPHVGHARSALSFDVIRRALEWRGLEVHHVSNITDVDDKIIARARTEGTTEAEIAARYEQVHWAALDRLGVLRPHAVPHATGFIPQMLDLVRALVDAGRAYATPSGVYFPVAAYPAYGELSHRRLEDLLESAGARVEVEPDKRSPVDFALWKAAKPDEPSWESPWGPGRPGWHIECSAMSVGLLGEGFDVHGGGIDLVFPHHENERAQSEAAGQRFARYWLHNAMVNVGGEKMAKSAGNFTTVEEAVSAHGPRALRLLVLQNHYRSTMEMTAEGAAAAAAALGRLDALARRARAAGLTRPDRGDLDAATVASFDAALDDDVNTPSALAAIFGALNRANAAIDSGGHPRTTADSGGHTRTPADSGGHTRTHADSGGHTRTTADSGSHTRTTTDSGCQPQTAANFEGHSQTPAGSGGRTRTPGNDAGRDGLPGSEAGRLVSTVLALMKVLGVDADDGSVALVGADATPALVAEREDARRRKDFVRADAIRAELAGRGVTVEDTPAGPVWHRSGEGR